MSLWVSLSDPEGTEKACYCRECGNEHVSKYQEEYFSANITHNLTTMAIAAGLYKAIWHPEQLGAKYAKDIIPILRVGLELMRKEPEYFKQHEAPNGWGTYEDFLPWVERYLVACQEYPDSEISANG